MSNAMAALNRSKNDNAIQRPSFASEVKNSPLVKVGRGVLSEARNNQKSLNSMWSEGASSIAKAGKSFLEAWKSGWR